jgi:hypothetical protein
MTTKVAYTFDGAYRDRFMSPAEAYRLLESWDERNFDKFIGKRTEKQACDLGYMWTLILDRKRNDRMEHSPGGVIMCGTTKDLKDSFLEFDGKPEGIRGIAGGKNDNRLLACFVRGRSSLLGEVKTLINIGPAETWWGAIGENISSFRPSKWKFIPNPERDNYLSTFTNPRECWSFKELIDYLDPLEKPLEGESKVDILDW